MEWFSLIFPQVASNFQFCLYYETMCKEGFISEDQSIDLLICRSFCLEFHMVSQ